MRSQEGLENVSPESRPKASECISDGDGTVSRSGSYAIGSMPAQDGLLATDSLQQGESEGSGEETGGAEES